jgi:predicted nucleotidyltransferase
VLKNLKQFSKLKKELKDKVVDIFIFGSFVKGKSKPKDIDVCLVFKDPVLIELIKKAQQILGEGFHVSSLQVDNFFTKPHSLSRTMMLEGISLFTKKPLSEVFGLKAELLFSYDLSNLQSSKKVRFVYLMRGRYDNKGLVNKWKGEFISRNAFLVSIDKDNEVREVFDRWDVKYSRKKIMLMN